MAWTKTAWRMRYQPLLAELGIEFTQHAPDLLLCAQMGPPSPFSDVPTVVEITMDAISIQPEMLPWIMAPNVVACFRNVLYRYRRDYERPFVDRDVYGLRWGERAKETFVCHDPPPLPWELWHKLQLVLPLYTPPSERSFRQTQGFPLLVERPYDVCFAGRMDYDGHGWPERHRCRFATAFDKLTCKKVFRNTRYQPLPLSQYLAWMMQSKIAISPWGWSAWNIRDYEALLCGCILIKPECSGVRSLPDLYDPWEDLIVWCDPDYRDLPQAIERALDTLCYRQDRVVYGRRLLEDHLKPRPLLERWAQALHVAAAT